MRLLTFLSFENNNDNNNLLHLYSSFLGTQSALHRRGESPQPPPMCSIHLDEVTAAILHQNAHHTPAYWWRGDSDEASQCMGMIRRPWWWSEANGEFGIFNDHRESGPRLTSHPNYFSLSAILNKILLLLLLLFTIIIISIHADRFFL